jgi:CheY-like chemotaxis protein
VATEPGRLLLLLASHDLQTAAQLAAQVRQAPAATLQQLQQLVTQGFLVVVTGTAGAVYHLRPKQSRADTTDLQERVLIVEDDLVVRELAITLLEDEHYAVISSHAPVDAVALLDEVSFDLVVTDSFTRGTEAALLARADILQAAGGTPVALFTAHRAELASVHAAGFRGLLGKPFDIGEFVAWVRALLVSDLGQDGDAERFPDPHEAAG